MLKTEFKDGITYVNLPKTSTAQVFIKAMGLLFSDKVYQKNPYSIWKINETELQVSPTGLKEIKDFVLKNRGDIPNGYAAVVVNSERQKGILLIYELISYELPVEMKIFLTNDEAINWLNSTLQK